MAHSFRDYSRQTLGFLRRNLRRLLPWSWQRRLYRWYAFRYINCLPRQNETDQPAALLINHFFGQDVRALTLTNRRFHLVEVDAVRLFLGAKIFFDYDVMAVRKPYDQADPTMVKEYRKECRLLLDRLKARFPLKVIITPSDVFYWLREMIVEARECGIPTVVLDKEGTISPYAFDAVAERIKSMAPLMSDRIFVWSERQREFWQRAGAEDARIRVIGQARSDLFYLEQGNEVEGLFPVSQPLISYFSFDDTAYLPRERIDSGVSWKNLKRETLDALMAIAEDFPGYNFLVKTHPQQSDREYLRSNYKRSNLRVIGGSTIGNELIQRSEMIIGFQTTALIEAMFLKRRVVYTAWDDNYRRLLLDDLLPFHEAPGIAVVNSLDEFQAVCRRFLSGDGSDFEYSPTVEAARETFVQSYLHKPDGHVCERFFD